MIDEGGIIVGVIMSRVRKQGQQLDNAHQRVPLSKGRLEGYVVECPLHFARFDVRTGELLSGPAAADVPSHEVHVEGDTVYVKRVESARYDDAQCGPGLPGMG